MTCPSSTLAQSHPTPASVLEEHHLRALVSVAATVAGAHELADVLYLAADQARAAAGVSFVSISRWELDLGQLRTLMNVGDLPPGLEERPEEEIYRLADYPLAVGVLSGGRPHVTAIDDEAADANERALLAEQGLCSCAAVPIRFEGRTWGELYAATREGAERLRASDIHFLQAVCAQLAVAIGRAELFSKVSKAAYEDALTGLANRRALQERLERSVQAARLGDSELTLLLGDIDGLKLLNDRGGHEAGDRAIATVGRILASVAGPAILPARIGGDEFCIMLDGAPGYEGEQLAGSISALLSAADPPVKVSWGVASLGRETRTPAELLRAADEAQYDAKRRGRRRSEVQRDAFDAPPSAAFRAGVSDLLADGFAALDAIPGASARQRATRLGRLLADQLGAAAWACSVRHAGTTRLEPIASCAGRGEPPSTARFLATRRLLERPGASVILAGVPDGPDAQELAAHGYQGLLVVSTHRAGETYLLELFADSRTATLADAAIAVRALLNAV